MNWILTIVVKAVLEWLTSLLVRLREKQEHIEQGRQEVKAAADKAIKEADEEVQKLRDSRPDFDAAIDELRKRAGGSSELLRSGKSSADGSSAKVK